MMNDADLFVAKKTSTILIAEDDLGNQKLLDTVIRKFGYIPVLVDTGQSVLDYCNRELPDLILLDLFLSHPNGLDILKQLRILGILNRVPVIVISSLNQPKYIAACIRLGARDYMVKPLNRLLLKARIEASLERKQLREREEQYYRMIEDFSEVLEHRVQRQIQEITQSHLATIFAMSKLAESRDNETGAHLERIRDYCSVLCQELFEMGEFTEEINDSFIDDIFIASPLHDIGKVAIPDAILQKPDKLTAEEFDVMKTHPIVGANTLREVHKSHPNNTFIRLGIEIAENHHERWDGSGYPHGRGGEEIPLSGRIIAVADVYDALTSKRCYKTAYSHEESVQIINDSCGHHFDPIICRAFYRCENLFHQIKNKYIE